MAQAQPLHRLELLPQRAWPVVSNSLSEFLGVRGSDIVQKKIVHTFRRLLYASVRPVSPVLRFTHR